MFNIRTPTFVFLSFCLLLSDCFPVMAEENSPIPDIRDAYGVGVADFDQNGLLDIYLVGFRTLNRLLLNNGNGTFSDNSIPSGAGGNLMPMGIRNLELGASVADYDNDGWVDILIGGWGDALELLRNRGDGTFQAVTKKVGLTSKIGANMGLWADLNLDGYLDLLLTNEHGEAYLYKNHVGLTLEKIPSDSSNLKTQKGTQGGVWVDLDLDGDLDLAIAGWIEPVQIFEQLSPFKFKKLNTHHIAPSGLMTNAVIPGDVDNDGDIDLLFTVRNGRNLLLENQANPEKTTESVEDWNSDSLPLEFVESTERWGLTDSLDSYGGDFADLDLDGDLDLFLTSRGPSLFYRNTGNKFQSEDLEKAGFKKTHSRYSTGVMHGDLTPSPGEEMVVASRDSICSLQYGPSPVNTSITIHFHGVQSNKKAVGAYVSIWKSKQTAPLAKKDPSPEWTLQQSFQIKAGEGYLSSYSGPLLIPKVDSVYLWKLRIRYPNGKVVTRGLKPSYHQMHVWEAGFLGTSWQWTRQFFNRTKEDPERIRFTLGLLGIVLLAGLSLKYAVGWSARSIARKQYFQELEQKNNELRKMVEEVRLTQQQLIHSEKLAALGRLVAGIAHELNNPIGFIYQNLYQIDKYVERLKKADGEEAEKIWRRALEALEESRDGALRVRDIVQNLRGIARGAEPGKVSLQKKATSVPALIKKALSVARTNFDKSTRVHLELDENIPEIHADETQLLQVFLNLLVNAGQAVDEKGCIEIRNYLKNDKVVVEISDNGHGIAKEHIHQIFEPFFTTKPVGQGIGLGLHLSYGIAEAHGGNLRVESVEGHGAKFFVELPVSGVNERETDS